MVVLCFVAGCAGEHDAPPVRQAVIGPEIAFDGEGILAENFQVRVCSEERFESLSVGVRMEGDDGVASLDLVDRYGSGYADHGPIADGVRGVYDAGWSAPLTQGALDEVCENGLSVTLGGFGSGELEWHVWVSATSGGAEEEHPVDILIEEVIPDGDTGMGLRPPFGPVPS